jgi:hypothetical protein
MLIPHSVQTFTNMSAAMGVGMGAQLVGGIMQMIAAKQAQGEMGDELKREMRQQQGFRNQALGVFQPHLQTRGVETARTQIAEGSQKRQQEYGRVGQTKLGVGQNDGGSARGQAQLQMRGQARGQLDGYSAWQLQQMITNIRAQDELNRISNFAGGQANIFPYKMQDAQHSADDLAAMGGLVASLGGGAANMAQVYGGAPPTSGVNASGLASPRVDGWGSNFGSEFGNIG